jgi:ATP-binding cassette subfamily C (CFTR/MRP) protein 1
MILFVSPWILRHRRPTVRFNLSVLVATDARLEFVSQTMKHVRAIKAYGWIASFADRIVETRAAEIARLRIVALLKALITILLQVTSVLMSLTTFALFTWTSDTPLTAIQAFTSLSLFSLLRAPLTVLPRVLSSLVDSLAGFERINRLMSAAELRPRRNIARDHRGGDNRRGKSMHSKSRPQIARGTVRVDAVDFFFEESLPISSSSATPTSTNLAASRGDRAFVRNAQLHFSPGSLTVCVGSVASGKSSLLLALLGELKARPSASSAASLSHSLFVDQYLHGTVAYVAQQAWIPNNTVRELICFGSAFDQQWCVDTSFEDIRESP